MFAYLADFENVPRWNYAIAETHKVTAGAVRVGTRYRQVRTVPSHSEESFEVVTFEPDHRLAILGQIGPLSGDIAYQLADMRQATVLNECMRPACHWRAERAGATRHSPLATRSVRSAVAANLNVLKQILEGRDE